MSMRWSMWSQQHELSILLYSPCPAIRGRRLTCHGSRRLPEIYAAPLSDWSSYERHRPSDRPAEPSSPDLRRRDDLGSAGQRHPAPDLHPDGSVLRFPHPEGCDRDRSEEHTSELQSL